MRLEDLGYDQWFEERRGRLGWPDCTVARVTRVDRDRFLVRNESSEVVGEPTGRLAYIAANPEDSPCVGDWVLVHHYNEDKFAIIHALFPRRTFLRRKAAGQRSDHQMIGANIDTAFIVQSCGPNFNMRRLERYLAMISDGGIEPVVLLSKSDLVDMAALASMQTEIRRYYSSVPVISFSSKTDAGLAEIRRLLVKGRTFCLLGSSGVGKTTLLNRILGSERFEVASVRESDGRGRHTTAARQMVVLDGGGLLIDTPGMRELGVIADDGGVETVFADIERFARSCRFSDCSHIQEEGCAVLRAVEEGALDARRYEGYLKLKKEAEFNRMSYAERRRKDRQLGRMYKSILKAKKKQKGGDKD